MELLVAEARVNASVNRVDKCTRQNRTGNSTQRTEWFSTFVCGKSYQTNQLESEASNRTRRSTTCYRIDEARRQFTSTGYGMVQHGTVSLRRRRAKGDFTAARQSMYTAQKIAKSINDRSLDASASMSIANLEVMFGNSREAEKNFQRSYELNRRLGRMEETCLLLGNMASWCIHIGNIEIVAGVC